VRVALVLGLNSFEWTGMARRFAIVAAEEGAQTEQARMLFCEYGASLGNHLCFESFEREVAGLPGEYKPPGGRLLLAFSDATPAGCVVLRKLENRICEMKRFYVRPEFRGCGLGRDLVLALIEQARRSSYDSMRLDTIAASMPEAVGLYRSLGFQEIAPYHGSPIPGAIHLELDLKTTVKSDS
jgi:ribosomal protein S18 acetylase RimI-like enzyme